MNLPDAIERLRKMHSDAEYRVKTFGGLMADEFQADIDALAICLEQLDGTSASRPPLTKDDPRIPGEPLKTIEELRTLTRSTILIVERGGPDGIEETVAPLRSALAERGLAPRCHVGAEPPLIEGRSSLTPDMTVEWYAGQLLDIVDKKAWFAMNSLINCVDKFCPEPTQSEATS